MLRQKWDHDKLVGIDVDLEISLKEYGIAWIEEEKKVLFYYGISAAENECGESEFDRFDFCSFNKDMDIKKEFDWAKWKAINCYIGGDIMTYGFPEQIQTLNKYYGYENIFGSTYWKGLEYADIVKEEV